MSIRFLVLLLTLSVSIPRLDKTLTSLVEYQNLIKVIKKMNIQCLHSDIISNLPLNIIENVLILMPIRDAVRTSILSRNWRSCWKSIPKLSFNDNLVKVPSNLIHLKEYMIVSAIFNVLLLHTSPILEFEYVGVIGMNHQFDQILLYLSRNKILKKCIFKTSFDSYKLYKLPCSFFSLQGLESLELKNCILELSVEFNGFSRLRSLSLIGVFVNSRVIKRFLSKCPILMDVTLEVIQEDDGENKFTFIDLVKCVPLLRTLNILEGYMKDLSVGGMPQKLPTPLFHLKYLILEEVYVTDLDQISSALCLLRNAPTLEKLSFTMYDNPNAPHVSVKCFDLQNYVSFNFDCLKELEMIYYNNDALELEFVKFIIAKSPRLEKVRIELLYTLSVDKELKIRDDLMRLFVPRGSASEKLRIERPLHSSSSCCL